MDYRELLEQLADEDNCDVLDYIGDAVTAITELIERAEKAERERDAAVREIPKICYYCKHRKGWKVCSDYSGNENAETCEKWEWRGVQEE